MATVTIFQAGADVISTGKDLFEAIEAAQGFGFDVSYDEIEIAEKGHGVVDGKIYYTTDYDDLMGE